MNPIRPMLARIGKPFSNRDWIFEIKIDGTRCIAHITNGVVELQNRRLRMITQRYPELTDALRQNANNCILDGEIAVFSKGVPDFASLAMREQQSKDIRINYLAKTMPANYIVFDILYKEGESLMNLSLLERKSILRQELQGNDFLTIIDFLEQNGEAYFKAAIRKGLEGVMAKRAASTYQPGVRSGDWLKIKKHTTLDLVIGGYTIGEGERRPFFGALLLGAYDSGNLVFIGRVGSGFALKDLEDISQGFKPSIESPFKQPPILRGAKWLKPELVVEVEVMEVTKKGHLRAPVFIRKRDDKSPEECTLDQLHLEKHKGDSD
jgi:DNA ligase D-like protein (predicted ligase)